MKLLPMKAGDSSFVNKMNVTYFQITYGAFRAVAHLLSYNFPYIDLSKYER